MNWTYIFRCAVFGLLTGVYSVAVTYQTVGFPIETPADIFHIICLFIVSAIGGVFAYARDPEKAWSVGPTAKALLLPILALGLIACAVKQVPEAVAESPLTTAQCEALAHAASEATKANDAGAAAIFRGIVKKGECF